MTENKIESIKSKEAYMKNSIFEIEFDPQEGGISRLSLVRDAHKMNFCRDGREMSVLRGFLPQSFSQTETSARAVSSLGGVEAVTEFSFDGEDLVVHTRLTNQNSYPVYFSNGDLCLEMPFNDAYEASDICMRERCHTHIWVGLESSYIRTERMGESDCHVGLVFEKGSFHSYRQEECNHSVRGYFALNVSAFSLQSGESHEICYRIFAHTGGADFFARARKIPGFLQVRSARGYSFFEGEEISFEVLSGETITEAHCTLRGEALPCKTEENRVLISFVPEGNGEHEVFFCVNGRKGKAVFNVLPALETLLKTRIDFIIDKQQCMDSNSPLYGAYLVYDNEEDRQYFDYAVLDHNANRERLGMSLTILKWLGTHEDARARRSLDLFTEFLLRECVDEEKGTCYGNIGKDERYLRLYNAPWVALYFAELYNLTKDLRWARLLARILHYYYGVGGAKFYPNGIRFATFYRVLQAAGLHRECEEIYAKFDEHVQMILRNGTNYPPHEVNYEQTIVTPAVTILLDKYTLSGEEFYLREAEKHLRILRKFDGLQPHFRLHNIPIRYWDDFWFGKKGTYGDVFPHYWSVLSGYGYHLYGKLTGDRGYEEIARQCMMNCLCNIYPSGRATCAYVYPEWVSGRAWSPQKHADITETLGSRKGALADAFANDQDFALYFFMKMQQDLLH